MKKSSAVVLSRICALMLVLFVSVSLVAQVQNGVFVGTVTDPQGAAVTGATLKITNQDTGVSATAKTNDTGYYTSQPLPVGVYKFEVTQSGFKTATKNGVKLDVGATQRLNFQMSVGQQSETIEVTTEAALVQVDDSKLSNTVGSQQIANLPLNGRNVYDLLRLAPGAQDSRGVITENSGGAIVNGVRGNFNGFTINGVSNKGLSGGVVNQPIQDTVQEFQQLTLNMSAQYGNSAGSITNLVTKGGTNSLHGSIFEFLRNDAVDANSYFNNNAGQKKPALRFNQFGFTLGGPIVKDKLFFYGAYQGDRFTASTLPVPVQAEGAAFRSAVQAALPTSVAALLYKDFAPAVQGTQSSVGNGGTVDSYILGGFSGSGYSSYAEYLCDGLNGAANVARFKALFGVTAADIAALPGVAAGYGVTCTAQTAGGGVANRTIPFLFDTINIAKTQLQGNLFNGNEASGRIDWNAGSNDRIFAQYNWQRISDKFLAGTSGVRGFTNPYNATFPNAQFVYSHTFTPTLLNEAKLGYAANLTGINTALPGVPAIGFDDATLGFGSYNGYPQFFKENIYTYSDMMSWTKGKHNVKFGADVRRNIENSEFNVGRPSYYFLDPFFFAADAPYGMAAGIDPAIANGGTGASAHLQSNIRHWRNVEFGAFFQDDWKMTSRLTLQLGLRYDLFTRHNELNDLATTFIPGPGTAVIDNVTTGAGQILNANNPLTLQAGYTTACTNPAANQRNTVLAGICGPGGFAPAKSLGKGDHNNFGPRFGFAYDVFGNGKTSLRGGFGVSYEGTLYNPLSNSRWNPPYYSFNSVFNFLAGDVNNVQYGPASGGTPRYTGAADPLNNQGSGSTAVGNIMGWNVNNPNQAVLTGIIFPQGIKDPYVYNYYLGVQHEFLPKWVAEVNYVGTTGHKLFRAENVNRKPGGQNSASLVVRDQFGRTLNGLGRRRLNPNYGRLRAWENTVNSNYNSLQMSLRKAMAHGFSFNMNYTFSHAIDGGSTWHSGATSANNRAGGEGFTSDQTMPSIDRSNSIFDVRHTIQTTYVWEFPWFKNTTGPVNWILGGWQTNGIISYHTGAHWSPYCDVASLCDFNRDGERNDRPDANITNFSPSKAQQTTGWSLGGTDTSWVFNNAATGSPAAAGRHFTRPCATVVSGTFTPSSSLPCPGGSTGSLGRNNFVGPGFVEWNPSLFKNFKFTEKVGMQFRWEMFNVLNHTNFQLPGANGANHNNIRDAAFGQAGGTFNPRQMQFGLKLSF